MNSRLNFRCPSSDSDKFDIFPAFEEAVGLLLDKNGNEFERRVKSCEIQELTIKKRDGNGRSLLVHAALADQVKAFMLLVKKGLSVGDKDKYGMTPFHYAVLSDSMKVVRYILSLPRVPQELAPFLVGDYNGVTPLHLAASKHSGFMLKTLLEAKRDEDQVHANAVDRNGRSPFHYAAMVASVECCWLLIDSRSGFSLDQRDSFGQTPMIIAAGVRAAGSAEIIHILASRKGNCLSQRSMSGLSALHMAVLADNVLIIELMLRDFNVNPAILVDTAARTPLHYAAQYGRDKAAALLLEHGANNSARDQHEVTAAHYAAQQDPKTLDIILKSIHYDLENVNDKQGRSIFMWAVLAGNIKTVEYCLRNDMLVIHRTETDKKGLTALHLATHMNNLELCKLLMQQGWNPSHCDNQGATPLHIAAGRGHTDIVRYLVTSGADSEVRDHQGRTPIFHACFGGKAHTLETMINSLQFNIDTKDFLQCTPLHAAAFAGHAACISALIKAGADVADTDKDEFTALHVAAEKGKLECCVKLLQGGAAVNAFSHVEQMTPVSCAAHYGHDKVVEYLRSNGGMTHEEVKDVAAEMIQKFWKKHKRIHKGRF
ncbi:hypothetical protein L596_010882 [Steinernema carpocapsae]|uniref:Uncharacterized protein n=1 Tax=Steinernema carpocapsae TaxID=34508 RepID=A0A4U5PJM3_STECR|nr:hypothetical protein L596_010882 [Steinernema carpocapsae]